MLCVNDLKKVFRANFHILIKRTKSFRLKSNHLVALLAEAVFMYLVV